MAFCGVSAVQHLMGNRTGVRVETDRSDDGTTESNV